MNLYMSTTTYTNNYILRTLASTNTKTVKILHKIPTLIFVFRSNGNAAYKY